MAEELDVVTEELAAISGAFYHIKFNYSTLNIYILAGKNLEPDPAQDSPKSVLSYPDTINKDLNN